MATLNDLVEEVLLSLEGFSGSQGVVGTLDSDITSAASTLTVNGGALADGLNFSTGLLEVGEELVYAQLFDRTTGIFTGCLRGWRGTTAAAHVAGEIIRSSPEYPRVSVRKAVNKTLLALGQLYAIKSYEFTSTGRDRYTLPADAQGVLRISFSPWGWGDAWEKVNQWSVVNDPSDPFDTTKAVDIPPIPSGRTIRVVYSAIPTTMDSLTDDFATTTGLPDWAQEIVVRGAVWRMLTDVDLSKVQGLGVDQAMQGEAMQFRSGQGQAKYIYAVFQQQLAEGVQRQQREWMAPRRWQYGARR